MGVNNEEGSAGSCKSAWLLRYSKWGGVQKWTIDARENCDKVTRWPHKVSWRISQRQTAKIGRVETWVSKKPQIGCDKETHNGMGEQVAVVVKMKKLSEREDIVGKSARRRVLSKPSFAEEGVDLF